MEDLRVDSTSPYSPLTERQHPDSEQRRKRHRPTSPAPVEDEVVLSSQQPDVADEPAGDTYTPSQTPDDETGES